MEIHLAKREKMKAAIAYIGGSGSGKTLSMIITGYGMMKEAYPDLDNESLFQKIGVIDTEHRRAQIYSGMTIAGIKVEPFYHIDLEAPFSVQRYEEGVNALKEAGCEVVVIDSLSHAWEGKGGILDLQNDMGGDFKAWGKVKPYMQQFIKTITASDVHILASMRTKQDYQTETSDTGKLQIKKMGLKPIQRDDLEYEFLIVWQLDQDHVARTMKDNSGMFEDDPSVITPEHGKKLYQWLEQGVDVKAEEAKRKEEELEQRRQRAIEYLQKQRSESEQVHELIAGMEAKADQNMEDMSFDALAKMSRNIKESQSA